MSRPPTNSIRLPAGVDAGQHERALDTPLATFPFDLQARLTDATTVQEVYETGVGVLARVPGTVAIHIFQRNDRGELVLVHAWKSPLAGDSSATPGELSKAVHQRWIAAHRLNRSPLEFVRPFYLEAHPCWLVVPMMVTGELIGAIAVERREGETFQYAPEDVVALSATAAGISWGLQSIFMRERTDLLRNAEVRAEIANRERREIGRELHDNVVQNLAYLGMKMEIIERYVSTNPAIATNELQAARSLLNRSIDEIRRTIGGLRKPASHARGITGQLRMLASAIAIDDSELEMDLKQISGVTLMPEIERAMVGIVREALQNVRKHARANSVRLEVNRTDNQLKVLIHDDGVGFEGDAPPEIPDHFGIAQMRELAEDLGGTLSIHSRAGNGTTIEASLPLAVSAGFGSTLIPEMDFPEHNSAAEYLTANGSPREKERTHVNTHI